MGRNPTRNPPGRPRAFSVERALDAATRVFAGKGYGATSVSDLTQAMGISRSSMYATFGTKDSLLRRILERFTQTDNRCLAACLAIGTARGATERLLRHRVTQFTDPNGSGARFISQGAVNDADATNKTRRLFRRSAVVALALKKRFDQAVREGELPYGTSSKDLARFYAVLIQGLALQAQHGGSKQQLIRIVDVAMRSWPEVPPLKPASCEGARPRRAQRTGRQAEEGAAGLNAGPSPASAPLSAR